MGNCNGTSGVNSGEKQFYNSHGDYIRPIDTNQYVADVGKLPELTGSEKQVAWAENIRNEVLGRLDKEHLAQIEKYNETVQSRIDMEKRGTDFSSWGKISKQEYENAIKSVESNSEAYRLAKGAVAEFYRQNPKASTVIDTRSSMPALDLQRSFQKALDQGKSVTADQGVKFIIKRLAKEGYDTQDMIRNFENRKK